METLGAILIGILIVSGLLIVFTFYNSISWGIVAKIIVSWYIIPLFPQFPVLSVLQYAGIMFFINCFIHIPAIEIKDEYKENNQSVYILLKPWLLLFCAWILHWIY